MLVSLRLPMILALCALASLLVLPACSPVDVKEAQSNYSRQPELPEVPDPSETVRGADDPPVVTLKIGSSLRDRRLSSGDELPEDVILPTTNLQGVPVTAALEAVLAGTDIALSYETAAFDDRIINLLNLSGPLPQVVERICNAARVFCNNRSGSLELVAQDTFIIELPPVEDENAASSTIADAIKQLSGGDVQVDTAGGNLIYSADYEGYHRVNQYLSQLRNGRPLIVMQMYIWEVSLDANNNSGISWTSFDQSGLGGHLQSVDNITSSLSNSAISAITGGMSLGAVLRGKVDANLVAKFLSTQGVVQTVSNPQMTFVSGSSANFVIGGTRRFISQVGQLVSNTVSGSSTGTSGIGTNTVSTDDIDVGLTIDVRGSYEGGVIFAKMSLATTDIIKVESVDTGSTQLQLPETSERKLETVLRVRPGDNLLLAGMNSSRDELGRDNIPLPLLGRLPLGTSDIKQNRELVILLKPSIVLFADDEQIEQARKEERRRPLPEPVVIDSAGTRPIVYEEKPRTLSDAADEAAAYATLSSETEAVPGETPVTAAIASGNQQVLFGQVGGTPVGEPGPDVSLVDRGMLQRGFSYAFDELLTPSQDVEAQP